jgi:hypothetical protein
MTDDLHEFRGEFRTRKEIADALGLNLSAVNRRLNRGTDLDKPARKFAPRAQQDLAAAGTSGDEMVIDDSLRFEDDLGAQVALRLCGGRCRLDQLAALYGVSWQAIQQTERKAMRKFIVGMNRLGLADTMRENLLSRNAIRRESYADRMDRMAPGKMDDFVSWNKTYSVTKLAAMSGRESEASKEMKRYSERGVAARLRRLGKSRAA